MKYSILTILSPFLMLFAGLLSAHHNSSALFDIENETTLNGTITRFDWKNPHLYFYLDAGNGDEVVSWRIEGRPLAFMRRLGWSRDTLRPGDSVTVVVHRSRNPIKTSGYLRDIEVAGRRVPPIRGEQAGARLTDDNYVTAVKPERLSGTWVTLANNELIDVLDNPANFNLTAAGQASLDSYDESTMHSALECIPTPPPFLMVVPDTKSIDMNGDVGRIRGDFDGTERLVYFDEREATEPSILGHSNGRWEGDVLHIETTHFAAHRLGDLYGVASGSQKRLQEWMELDPDGTRLTYRFEMTDSEFLAKPLSGSVQWAFRPDIEFTMSECDLENSRLYLEDED